jgi:hypothetical protein
MSNFATLADVKSVSGATYTAAEEGRIEALLPLVCDALRYEADKVGKDLDVMAESSRYANVLKLVTCDVVIRAMRQSTSGDPMSQESQVALGYSWSGTYAIPGGGIAQAIMKNDLKRLGLRRQRMGVIDLWPTESLE